MSGNPVKREVIKLYLSQETDIAKKDPLIQSTVTPLIIGDESVESYFCPHCDTNLIKGCSLQRLVNIRIECPRCKNTSTTTQLQEGGLLGGTRNVVIQPGTYHWTASVHMKGIFSSLVGYTAIEKRDQELGRNHIPNTFLIESNAITNLLDELRAYFGKKLGTIKEVRFRTSVLEMDKCLKDLNEGHISHLQLEYLLELHVLNSSLKRWRNYPNFDKILADYKADYLHATCLVATASALADQGNDLEITIEKQGLRTPDLTLAPTWNTRVATEIKTPLILREGKKITDAEARDVVNKAFKSAGTQEGGQLSPERQGMLIIGSYGLDKLSLDKLNREAENNFKRVKGKRTHIIAVIFTNINFVKSKNANGKLAITPLLESSTSFNPEYNQQEFVRSEITHVHNDKIII